MTSDIAPGFDLTADVTALPFRDEAFDLIVCSHVLEHVPDDSAAMAELCRITTADGLCVVMVPYRADAATDEDPSVVSPEERLRRFGQEDHVRSYGVDIIDRLQAAGFVVDITRAEDVVPAPERARLRLDTGPVLVARRRG